ERPVSGPVFGLLFALKAVSDRLHITSVLGRHKLAKTALFLILARISAHGSRLHALKWSEDHAVAETLGIKIRKDDLYFALDWLADHQESIEKRLFKKRYEDGEIPDLFLYDVTSSYFEGTKNELADWGYNRDRKNGKMRIVIGLLTDKTGEPVAVRVFEGNTADTSTFPEQILTVAKKFKVGRVTFVGDKGMIRGPQISQLEKAGFNYITSITKKEINTLLKNNCIQYELFSETVAEVEHETETEKKSENGETVGEIVKKKVRYVIRRNPWRMSDIRKNRNSRIRKIAELASEQTEYLRESERRSPEVALRKVEEKIVRCKLAKVLSAELCGDDGREIKVTTDPDGKSEIEKLDGCYVIKTDLSERLITAEEVHDRYKDLSKVEKAFRIIKTEFLEIRPIFVRLEKRTRGHVFACMLAYTVLREIRRGLRSEFGTDDEGRLELDEDNMVEALSRITLLFYKSDDGEMIPGIAEPDQRQKRILGAIGVKLPDFGLIPQKPN
ncbi:MAG: IS1634 family transposase, partial [Lentisphaerae bacterium]|nr:IS1634 family transposase [Lentisphaerota bacterium]